MSQKREYELIILVTSDISEPQAEEFVESFIKEKIEERGGKVTFRDDWGRKRLAYPIKNEEYAYYFVIWFEIEGVQIAPLDEEILIEKNVIRHLTTLVEKHQEKITREEILSWNKEHLPEKKKTRKEKEIKVAPRGRKKPYEKKPEVKVEKEKNTKLDKKQLDKKLDEILEGDLDV